MNVYDSLGRVTSQTDPMGYQTTFNYCVNAAAGDCMNTATGTGLVTVTDPDGNKTVYAYTQGTLAARVLDRHDADLRAGLTCPTRTPPAATLLDARQHRRRRQHHHRHLRRGRQPRPGDAPAGAGSRPRRPPQSSHGAGPGELRDAPRDGRQPPARRTPTGPAPVAPGGVITPAVLGAAAGRHLHPVRHRRQRAVHHDRGLPAGRAAPPRTPSTTYPLYRGNSVTLNGTTITCTTTPPSPSLPCATINADGVVTQLGYDCGRRPDLLGDPGRQRLPGRDHHLRLRQLTASRPAPSPRMATCPARTPGTTPPSRPTTPTADKTSVTLAGGAGGNRHPAHHHYGYDAERQPDHRPGRPRLHHHHRPTTPTTSRPWSPTPTATRP